ncbi:nuclease-related domain-containing protein [Virgibacillus doumboii]|uniref:nuclease-related domain-containing protein n=1 Tax=Virgibacillus doumboii TaxID=2697503 RepID=UPI0013DF7296|nr:nuclease-related domain-containing protein [Virgibacillus doumboii]
MYVKPLTFPVHIQKALALDRRIADTHPEKQSINSDAAKLSSGYKGEESLIFHLNFLPEDDFLIFHYLRIPDDKGHFQLDFLILSIYFFLIIEVKNIYDHVNFDEMGQAYRELNDEIKNFGNPVFQVNLQHRRLLNYLREMNYPTVPIEKIVVFSSNDTYLRNLSNNKIISDIVMHRDKVLPKIDSFIEKNKLKCLSDDHLMKLSYHLLEDHRPEEYNEMEKKGITTDDLIKGVFCPGCGSIPMIWKSGKWLCENCGLRSKTAHRPTLCDYRLLVGEYINNREARGFLKLDSNSITRKSLQAEGLDKVGVGSGMRYRLDLEKLTE